jgi:hypothetical protein
MSERLTDEQLHEWRDEPNPNPWLSRVEIADELLALRAKLAMIGRVLNEYSGHPVVRMITLKIASIK